MVGYLTGMEHLALLIFFISMLTGFLFIGLFGYLQMKYEYPLLRIHFYQLIFYSMHVFIASLYYYGWINMGFFKNQGWQLSLPLFLPASLTPLIYFMGRSYYFVAGVKWTLKIKIFFIILALTLPVFILLQTVILSSFYLEYLTAIVFLVNIWCYGLLVANYKKIDDPLRKFIAKLVFFIPAYSIPIGIIDALVMQQQAMTNQPPFGITGQPIVYFLNNTFSMIVLLKARSIMQAQKSAIPHSFVLQYAVTPREKEILELLEKGLSNKEIASKLFISPSTARNHLSAIFEKTTCPTRTRLISLIRTFR